MLSLIIKQIREYFRSPANVFMGLLFPVLLVFFLGTMLQNLDIADYDIGEIKLQYSVTQTDEQSGKAFAEFLDNISMIKAEKASDEKTALSLTDKGDIDAYIELKNGEILLYGGRNEIANRALGSVLNSYIAVSDTYYKIASTDPSLLMNTDTDTEKSFVEQDGLGVTRSMMDYYAVSMAVMMIFMSHMIMGSTALKDEERIFTLQRLYLSPVGKVKLFFRKAHRYASLRSYRKCGDNAVFGVCVRCEILRQLCRKPYPVPAALLLLACVDSRRYADRCTDKNTCGEHRDTAYMGIAVLLRLVFKAGIRRRLQRQAAALYRSASGVQTYSLR